jgi:hypothetical protein
VLVIVIVLGLGLVLGLRTASVAGCMQFSD